MTNDKRGEACALPTEMELLMFHAAGVKMAVETVRVDCIMSGEQAAQQGISSCRLNKVLGSAYETSPEPSTVILYKNGSETCGLGIDGLDEITTVPIRAIQPLPEPLSYFAGPRLFQGIVLHGNDVVLILDLYRLKSLNPCKAVLTA